MRRESPALDRRRREQLRQERIHPEQGRKQQNAAIAILDVGAMDDRVEQQT